MKHLISFQKKKGLHVIVGKNDINNMNTVKLINHQLMKHGFILSEELANALATKSSTYLTQVYNQLSDFLRIVVGGSGYEPIYRNFPQSVIDMTQAEFVWNAIRHYWSGGAWRPEDAGYLRREFAFEPVKYKTISLLTAKQYDSIFTDIIYSGDSISTFDKDIISYNLSLGAKFNFNKISFNETKAYIGRLLLTNEDTETLPTQDATLVLRMYSAYSGGDEGLKENTRFKNPRAFQRRILLRTLEGCYNLEEAFKMNREKWLRLLFYLHPMSAGNAKTYPTVAEYADLLRNNPKKLKTFNAYVDAYVDNRDPYVLEFLKKRPGVFTRKLDHMVRVYGYAAINKWMELDLRMEQLITAYNHFIDRAEKKNRGAVLAGAGSSEVVTYGALEPLDSKLVLKITSGILSRLQTFRSDEKVFIDRALYYRPLATNNRASSLSLGSATAGTTERVDIQKTLRMYVHWHGSSDIDLSGLAITKDNQVVKVGWNGRSNLKGIVYSGDNTGRSAKNAEYLDITPKDMLNSIEWVIVEARIYRGPSNYAGYGGKARAGWMLRSKPEANIHWLPETIDNAIVLNSTSRTSYLSALHVPTGNIVMLDLAMGDKRVSSSEDGIKMRQYLETFVTLDDGSDEVKWDKINQGHVLSLLYTVVDDADEADIVFDENTTAESVTACM